MTNGWALADDIHILNSYIAKAVEFDYNASLVGVNAWDQIYVNDLWGQMDVSTLIEYEYYLPCKVTIKAAKKKK